MGFVKAEWKINSDPVKRLDEFSKQLRKRIILRSMTGPIKLVRSAMRSGAPVRYGFLKKAVKSKRKAYRSGNVIGVVGIATKQKHVYGTYVRGKRAGQPKIAIPSKYAHFITGGTVHNAPHDFVTDAKEQTTSQYLSQLKSNLRHETLREFAK